MKLRTTMQALMLLVILLPAWAVAAGLGELRLSLVEGDVQIKNVDTGEWAPAALNLPLKDGDQLWVPEEGRAEVETRRGSIVRLDERSLLEILRVDNDALQFYLSMGLCYVNAKGERGTTLQMDTPISSIRVYERAKFSAEVVDDGLTEIAVFLGHISAENSKGVTRVEAGSLLSLGDNSADISPLGLADAWEQWNKDQDRIIEERRESVRYLPDELAGYSRDFDDNGEWIEDPSYGYVWRPIVEISIGWSPYRHGRWVWIGSDFVWVASERWGWAPYHYGRWSHFGRHGWCWVPPERHDVFWGPGYVGWVRTSSYVSWVPLAPRETYYGHGHFGRHSVNIINVDITKVVVQKNVYKNVYIDNSVTNVDHDTFIGRKKGGHVKVKENPFLKEKISVGRPRIKPERATKVSVIKEVSKDKAPPAKAGEIDVAKLKERRRLAKKEGQSVFRPDKAPEAMPVEERKEPKARPPRKPRRVEKEREQGTAPATGAEIQPQPGSGEGGAAAGPSAAPREGKQRSREPKVAPSTEGRSGGEGREGRRRERQPGTPAPQTESPATGDQVDTAPPAEPRRRPRRTPPGEVEQGQPAQSGGGSEVGQPPAESAAPAAQPRRRPRRTPPGEVEQVQPVPSGGGSEVGPPPAEPTAPPVEPRRRPRRTPPGEMEQGQPVQSGGGSEVGPPPAEPTAPPAESRRRPRRTPPAEAEQGQPFPSGGESEVIRPPADSGAPSAPPPEPRRRERRRPPTEVEGGQPPQDGGGEGRQRREQPPVQQWQEVQPPPPEEVAPPASRRRAREPQPWMQGGQPAPEGGMRERRRQEIAPQPVAPPPEPVRIEPPPVVAPPPPPAMVEPPPVVPQPAEVTAPQPAEGKRKARKKKPGQEEPEPEAQQ